MNGESGLLRTPPEFIPFVVLGMGGILLVVITILHGVGYQRELLQKLRAPGLHHHEHAAR